MSSAIYSTFDFIVVPPVDEYEFIVIPFPPIGDGIVNGTSSADTVDQFYVDADGDSLGYGDNIVLLGSSADTFIGGIGNNDVTGGGGGDTLIGVTGYNVLNGNGGNDSIYSGDTTSQLLGGFGNDDLFMDVSKGADHTATGGAGSDLFAIEGLADDRASLITITDFDVELDTLTLNGVDANDPSTDFDNAFARDGDLYLVTGGTMILIEDVFPSEIDGEYVLGTPGMDSFTLNSVDGDGTAITNGDDIVFLEGGDDFVRLGKGDDIAFGGDGDDTLMGQKGNNMLYGEDGNDTLDSGHHASVLNGGLGDDVLSANLTRNGEHILSGGQGADTFTFYSNKSTTKGTAIVQDFEVGIDTLDLDGSFSAYSASYEETDEGLLVSFDNGSDVMFLGLGYEDAVALGLDDPFAVG